METLTSLSCSGAVSHTSLLIGQGLWMQLKQCQAWALLSKPRTCLEKRGSVTSFGKQVGRSSGHTEHISPGSSDVGIAVLRQ